MIYLAYTSVSCVIMKKVKAGTYELNHLLVHVPLFPTMEHISQLRYTVGTMEDLISQLAYLIVLSQLSYPASTVYQRNCATHSGLGPPTPLNNPNNSLQTWPQASLTWEISQLRVLSQVTLTYIKLIIKAIKPGLIFSLYQCPVVTVVTLRIKATQSLSLQQFSIQHRYLVCYDEVEFIS